MWIKTNKKKVERACLRKIKAISNSIAFCHSCWCVTVIAMLREINKLIVFRAAKIKGLMTRKPSETMYQVNRFEQWSEQILQQEYNPMHYDSRTRIFYSCGKINHFTHDDTVKTEKLYLQHLSSRRNVFFSAKSANFQREILYVLAIVFALNGYPVSSYNSNLFDGNGERIIIYYLINRNANLFV